jgi:hypothetical protein
VALVNPDPNVIESLATQLEGRGYNTVRFLTDRYDGITTQTMPTDPMLRPLPPKQTIRSECSGSKKVTRYTIYGAEERYEPRRPNRTFFA